MAGENPRWGYTQIRDALANLGHPIGRNTVKRILQDHGIEPASERSRRTPWKTFLQAHWEGLAAADLFTVEVLTLGGLRRYFVLFVAELKTRRVKISGIYHQPYGEWMEQMARNLTDVVDGFLRNARHLIHDRDPLYTRSFDEILKSAGVQPVRLPPRSPNLNAYAERFVRSVKITCAWSFTSTSSTTIWRKTTRDSTTSCSNGHRRRRTRRSRLTDEYASVDSSTTTIAKPHELWADYWHTTGSVFGGRVR